MRFSNLAELVALAEREGKPMYEIMIEEHVSETGATREAVVQRFVRSDDGIGETRPDRRHPIIFRTDRRRC